MDEPFYLEIFRKGRNRNMAIVVPELFSDATNAAMDHHIRIGKVAFDATELVPDIRTCGDKIHFPTIDRVATGTTMTKGTALVPAELSMTDNEAEIKQTGSAIRIYDKDAIQVKGAVVDQLAIQVGEAMADAIDKHLVKEMDDNAVYKVATASGTEVAYVEIEAGFDVFGDDVDVQSYAGIIINSRLRKSFMAMPQFTKIDYTFAKVGNGVGDAEGIIGYWNGIIPVIVCDNDTYDTVKSECKTYIVKKKALGIIKQKDATTEEERESLKKATLLSADELYAVKLLNTKGVCILRKTIA